MSPAKRAATSPKSKTAASPKSSAKSSATSRPRKTPAARLTLAETMRELESAGSEQTRKTYTRHGGSGPMFGVSFATLKAMTKRIGVDHELALALWETGNFDARNLAVKIVDPARMSSADLDHWVGGSISRVCGGYAAMLAAEGPNGVAKVKQWLASKDEVQRIGGWVLLGQVAARDEAAPDALFTERLAFIERTIHAAPNREREVMNGAVIAIGLRNAALRKAAVATAKRIGTVDVDHGDTACKTADAVGSIEKAWAHSLSKGFDSPAAHERTRDVPRLRC